MRRQQDGPTPHLSAPPWVHFTRLHACAVLGLRSSGPRARQIPRLAPHPTAPTRPAPRAPPPSLPARHAGLVSLASPFLFKAPHPAPSVSVVWFLGHAYITTPITSDLFLSPPPYFSPRFSGLIQSLPGLFHWRRITWLEGKAWKGRLVMAAPPHLLLPRVMFRCWHAMFGSLFLLQLFMFGLVLFCCSCQLVDEFVVYLAKFRVVEVCCILVEGIQGGREVVCMVLSPFIVGFFSSSVAAACERYRRCKYRSTYIPVAIVIDRWIDFVGTLKV